MAPQTRSAAKPSPGRSTRNSTFGRQPLSPSKPRSGQTDRSTIRTAPARGAEAEGKRTSHVGSTKGTPWLACRDAHGVMTTVAVSETGEGVHVRWHYLEEDCEASAEDNKDDDADVEMSVDDERDATPLTTTAGPDSSEAPCRPFPRTPMALLPYDAGSVIQTPVKKPRPLQRSPLRIGDKGIRCLYEKGGILRELNGGARVVFRHPVGSAANLSREQVEQLEKEREEKIIQVQVEKLFAQKQRIEEEERQFSDSGYEDEMATDLPLAQHGLQREGTDTTILVSHSSHGALSDIAQPASPQEVGGVTGFFRGPNGELLDCHGRQILGREGTILIDSTYAYPRRIKREEAFVISTENADHHHHTSDHCAGKAKGLRQTRFGPEGTEFVD